MRILVLADRDWTHPEAGGSGHNLARQVREFQAQGHSVSVLAAAYPGAAAAESIDGVEVRRIGGRTTVFPRAILGGASRALAAEADVVLEIINGITFLTPLWLRTPRVALVHHVHAGRQYVEEMGWLGRPAGFLFETVPLRRLYGGTRFVCVSRATEDSLVASGIPRAQITVAYNGFDPELLGPARRAPEPTFVVLGRLKRYKRIELVLEALARVPQARLDIAGDGSHHDAIVAAVVRLGLQQRVTLHGRVSDETKRELLRSAWAHVTASAAEGWGLTVTEAAACGTPSVGLATGGLREAIIHERTGLLARDSDELREHLTRLAGDRALVERLGAGARERVGELTWQRTAEATVSVLSEAVRDRVDGSPLARALRSDTARSAGLAGAVIANNAIAVLCTVLFARWLGLPGYGTLASLLSCFLILTIPGAALQAAVARDVSREPDGAREALARRALGAVVVLSLPIAAGLALARAQIASLLGIDLQWASAAAVWFGWLWIGLSLQRGLLQGHRRYLKIGTSLIAEAIGRLLFGTALVALGLGTTGALLGNGFAIVAAAAINLRVAPVRLRGGRPAALWELARHGGAPLLALSLLAIIQNADVILVRRGMSAAAAGMYSVAAVAARGILWFGVGLGLFLLPEAARRARDGIDARAVLAQMIGLVCLIAVPLTVVYAVAGVPLLERLIGFHGSASATGAALPVLSIAMTLLSASYLVVQYLIALGRRTFALPLAVGALLQCAAVLVAGHSIQSVVLAIVAVQAGLLGALLVTALAGGLRELPGEISVAA